MADEEVVKEETVKEETTTDAEATTETTTDAETKTETGKEDSDPEKETLIATKEDELTPKQRDKVQERMDALTARIKQQERELNEFKTSKSKTDEKPVWTEDKLVEVITDPNQPQSAIAWAQRELNKLDTKNMLSEVLQNSKQFQARQNSIDQAAEIYPDLGDPESEMWKLANEIYVEKGLDKVTDGQMIAAELATSKLNKKGQVSAKVLEKRLEKEQAKKGLISGGKKVIVSDTASFDKLKKQAMVDGPDSKAWKDWQKQIVIKAGSKVIK